ncbi:MAG: hypothetical protein ACE5Z5_01410 [Candidatus Bathyarchaeia archaeon]
MSSKGASDQPHQPPLRPPDPPFPIICTEKNIYEILRDVLLRLDRIDKRMDRIERLLSAAGEG